MENGEWKLLGFPGTRTEYSYEGATYVKVEYTLQIQRRTIYYFFNLILPCVLIGNLYNILNSNLCVKCFFFLRVQNFSFYKDTD